LLKWIKLMFKDPYGIIIQQYRGEPQF
jgi:hypothetical protein